MNADEADDFENGNSEAYRVYCKACDELRGGQFERALEMFEASNRLSPHFKTCFHIGECLVNLGRHQDAIIPFAAATTLNRQGVAPLQLAKVFMALNEPDKAHEFVRLAIERQPQLKQAQELEPLIREAAERRSRELFGE
jgi:tetratricopeptide (TPR) repeat protein